MSIQWSLLFTQSPIKLFCLVTKFLQSWRGKNLFWTLGENLGVKHMWKKTAIFTKTLYITSFSSISYYFSGLTRVLHKKLKLASANALKLCTPDVTILSTHSEIHKMADRATPMKMCQYRHAIMLYKMFKSIICENEFIQMNFQLFDNERNPKIVFTRNQTYDVGKNTLLNRFCDLNNMIDKAWLELSLDTYKVKCKELFLKNRWWLKMIFMWPINYNLNALFLDHNKRLNTKNGPSRLYTCLVQIA